MGVWACWGLPEGHMFASPFMLWISPLQDMHCFYESKIHMHSAITQLLCTKTVKQVKLEDESVHVCF